MSHKEEDKIPALVEATDDAAHAGTSEEDLPLLARLLNHILTPGSSLTPFVWVSFNVIMVGLLLIWLMFLYAMPTSIHVWAFGFLGLGLAVSTNWFMYIVFTSGLDFASQQKEEEQKRAAEEEEKESKKEK